MINRSGRAVGTKFRSPFGHEGAGRVAGKLTHDAQCARRTRARAGGTHAARDAGSCRGLVRIGLSRWAVFAAGGRGRGMLASEA